LLKYVEAGYEIAYGKTSDKKYRYLEINVWRNEKCDK
jgi:hypothetical protein